MKSFRDNAGRVWLISIHVTAVKRCRALVGVDLYGLVDKDFDGLGKLLGDPCSFVDVLYCLCKDEADKLGITDEDFGRSLGGDSIEYATNAFLEELTDFFPDPRVRAGLTKVLAKMRQLRDRMMDHAETILETIDIEVEAKKLIGPSGRSQERSESTQGHSLSENSPEWLRGGPVPFGPIPVKS